MKGYTIHQGKHFSRPRKWGLWFKRKRIECDVVFGLGCKYRLEGEDAEDWNKVFGIGFFPSHKKNSARFAWRWNEALGVIEITAYCYINGTRVTGGQWFADLGKPINLVIALGVDEAGWRYYFYGNGIKATSLSALHRKKFSFPCGFYFGGTQTAPHDMRILMQWKK